MKKISNKTKDKIYITFFLIGIMWLIILLFVAIVNLFATDQFVELSEQEQINKYYRNKVLKTKLIILLCGNIPKI